MADYPYSNETTQAERRQIERDSYLTRAQADADLTSQGRFKKETATRVTGVPTYPPLPASSPWSGWFDQNIEPALGFSVDEMPEPVPNLKWPLHPLLRLIALGVSRSLAMFTWLHRRRRAHPLQSSAENGDDAVQIRKQIQRL